MATLWLQFGGVEKESRRLNLPVLSYPLSYNVPEASWKFSGDEIKLLPSTKTYSLHIDLVIEIKDGGRNIDENDAGSWISGYRLCVGVSDETLAQNIEAPTERDRITLAYYARFPYQYNLVSSYLIKDTSDFTGEITIEWKGQREAVKPEFNVAVNRQLSFLSGFTRLNAGDLISAGVVWTETGLTKPSELIIEIESMHWNVNTVQGDVQ